ncbi:MAG: ATP-dependent DNA helicase RecG [Candidatus Margulisiibacteriota bacterium]
MTPDLDTPVQYLKGVGPSLAKLFSKLGVSTVRDLLFYFPRDWEDRRNIQPAAKLSAGEDCLVKGIIKSVRAERTGRGFNLVKAVISDDSGSVLATWFNQPFVEKTLNSKKGSAVIISGRADINPYSGGLEISVKDYELPDGCEEALAVVPKYPLTAGLYQKTVRRIMKKALELCLPRVKDPLPEQVSKELGMGFSLAVKGLHFPSVPEEAERCRQRIAFNEFFLLQSAIAIRRKEIRQDTKGIAFDTEAELVSKFLSVLPFELTGAQKKVLGSIKKDMASCKPMNRLVQGDVGSGKTIVAVISCVTAVSNGYQAAIMAPTEILAQQHYFKIKELVSKLGIKVQLITAGENKKSKRLKSKSEEGNAIDGPCIVVGTHALIQESIKYSKLGLVVIDEQHRFGVMQRTQLRAKGNNPDLLVMTATPIPRTLAFTIYGDLDRSVIDELPPGRTPVMTKYVSEGKRASLYGFMEEEISKGRQAYVVCPLIEESEKIDLKAARQTCDTLKAVFSDHNVELMHGRMKPAEKEKIMKAFKENKIQVLVSTTVIEVGIDISNASIMLIEHVERFGLSQLHQLRGRIGRGAEQSYCFLMGKASSEESKARVKVMLETNDGFKIAEADLKLRGPGEFLGVRQSGLPEFKAADIIRDAQLLEKARKAAFDIISNDPDLAEPQSRELKTEVFGRYGKFFGLDVIN